ncbi:MAG: hypothetical protein ACJATP_002424 [Candidatus Azotimanducaceae bacterium]|jgi:hypothetical protein
MVVTSRGMTGLASKAAVYTKAYPRVYSQINTPGSPVDEIDIRQPA